MISKSLPNNYKGGIQTHVWELSTSLIKYGYEINILTAGNSRRGAIWRPMNGRMIITIPYFPGRYLPIFRNLIEELSFNILTSLWLKRHGQDYDVIHIQGRSGLLFPSSVADRTVMTIHRPFEIESKWSKDEYSSSIDRTIHRWVTKWLERRCLKRAAATIGISQCTVEEAIECIGDPPRPMHMIYNGVSFPPEPKIIPKPNLSQLLFVGRLAEIKGVFPLIDAMLSVREDIKLIMVGEGPARQELAKKIQDLGLDKRVFMIGNREHKEVFDLIRKSYALILPSFHESQGIVLMESNICNRPVLAASVGGAKEVVLHNKNGLLFPPGQPMAIAEAINRLFQDPQRANEMGRWGRKFVEKYFAWDTIAQETAKVYKDLC